MENGRPGSDNASLGNERICLEGSGTKKGHEMEEQSNTSTPTLNSNGKFNSESQESAIERYSMEAPKSPQISVSESMELTPCTSQGNEVDDFVLYSDSDGASQHSLDLKRIKTNNSTESESSRPKNEVKTTPRTQRTKSSGSKNEETPKSRRKARRRSNKSDTGSEKSHRSSVFPHGSGYTSMPATGKIFRNLLILEESLRQQMLQQRALRRKYLTFLAVLCSFITSLTHHLYFLDPSLSSSGTLRVILQFTLFALTMTVMLYHLSGEYQKTIVLPRKFLSSTNKGLRQLNVRLVKIKTSFIDSIVDFIREGVLFVATMCLTCLHNVYPSTKKNKNSKLEVFLVSCQMQCQPKKGLNDVKLTLNARVFSTDMREGWEMYRNEFWIHEGVRIRSGMLAFANERHDNTGSLDRGRLLKKDKKERRERKRSNVANSANHLNERNLNELSLEYDDSPTPIRSSRVH